MNRKNIPVIAIICILIVTHIAAIAVVNLYPSEYRAFGEDVDDPVNPLLYIGLILLFTGVMLAVLKFTKGNFLQYAILGIVGLTLFYVFYPVFFYFIPYFLTVGSVNIDLPLVFSIVLTITLTYVLYKYPEWYVVDGVGIIIGAGIAGIFGMSFGILPVFILLIILAVYDFISVYKTKHMLSLASGVMKMKVPVMLVVPRKLNYSFAKEKGVMQKVKKNKKRDAMFVGLGDIIIPGILPVSASLYLPRAVVYGISAPLLVAGGAIIGTVFGMVMLMILVLKGKPHAGLPLLNSGVILGYVVSYLLIYQNFSLGMTIPW